MQEKLDMTSRRDTCPEDSRRKRLGGRSGRVTAAAYEAALDLYEPGEPMPSLPRIAMRAGVQKTTLYRRWDSAEALLHEALAATAEKAISVPDTGTLEGDLRVLARRGHDFLSTAEGRDSVHMLMAAEGGRKEAYWRRRYASLGQIFERAMARGEIARDAPWVACIDAVIGTAYFQHAMKGARPDLEAQLVMIDALCRGIRKDP